MDRHDWVRGFGEFIVFMLVFLWHVRLQDRKKKHRDWEKMAIGQYQLTPLLYNLIVSYKPSLWVGMSDGYHEFTFPYMPERKKEKLQKRNNIFI